MSPSTGSTRSRGPGVCQQGGGTVGKSRACRSAVGPVYTTDDHVGINIKPNRPTRPGSAHIIVFGVHPPSGRSHDERRKLTGMQRLETEKLEI